MDFLGLANSAIRRMLVASGVRSEYRSVLNNVVHYYRADGPGLGPPMLMVHGLGSSGNSFFRALKPLTRKFRSVWAIDIPGNGFSPLPPSGPVPLREQVKIVTTFINDVIGEPVFLVGNSLGGAMSFFAAHEAPQSIKALTLIAPAGARVDQARLDALVKSFKVETNAQARSMTRRLFHKAPLGILMFAGELRKLYASETVRSILSEVGPDETVTEEMLKGLAMPTMLIWGKSEKLLPYESIDYFRAHLPPHAEVHEVAGYGHMPQMERPRDVVKRIVKFAQTRGLIE